MKQHKRRVIGIGFNSAIPSLSMIHKQDPLSAPPKKATQPANNKPTCSAASKAASAAPV
jgi:hypothetical protein